jgi:hypothetical protein
MRIRWQLRRPEASTTTAFDSPSEDEELNIRQGDIVVWLASQRIKRRHLPAQIIALDPQ